MKVNKRTKMSENEYFLFCTRNYHINDTQELIKIQLNCIDLSQIDSHLKRTDLTT